MKLYGFTVRAQGARARIAPAGGQTYVDIRFPHGWRGRHPQLKQWFDGIAARKSFGATLPPGFVRL